MTGPGGSQSVLHCYFREHIFMTPREAADIRARFAVLAEREGYQLGSIFVEKPESAPNALWDLVDAVNADGAAAVAVPSMRHLTVAGDPEVLKQELEAKTGARLIVMNSPP